MSEKKPAAPQEAPKAAAASTPAPVPAAGGSYTRDPVTGQLVRQHGTGRDEPKDRRNGPAEAVAPAKQGD